MRIHRIHTKQALEPESEFSLHGGPAHYLSRVLRVVPGLAIVLFNGGGCDYAAEVTSVGKSQVLVRVLSPVPLTARVV